MRTIEKVRTPETEFRNLKDYPFAPNYIEVTGGLRLHYVDEGKENPKTIFLLHGQPSWSYLYRHMIPQLVNAGFRVIAPDLIGFGKSDKPVNSEDITFQNHVTWMSEFVNKLGITNAAAFMQDWGGMIGLRVLANNPTWLKRLVVANTALAEFKGLTKWLVPKMINRTIAKSGKPTLINLEAKTDYKNWVGYFRSSERLDIGKVMQILTTSELDRDEMRAYNAPFPDETYYAAPRKMPEIVATDLTAVNKDWEKLKRWNNPVLTLFSDEDPFLKDQGYDKKFQKNFKGAKGQPHITVTNASHFLQEDQTEMLLTRILNWLNDTKF
ncbi:MAG: haloalkane dehalogenase [Bacteroidales bacterium]|jgi:haloalkane dehalogenase|nr:haloalkane dehalogenase [Bacteroidales bacterium]